MRLPDRQSIKDKRILVIYLALGLQVLSALFFVGDLWSEVLNLRSWPIPWQWQEIIQVLASIGLVTGVAVSFWFLRLSLRRMEHMGRQIDAAAGNFQEHLSTHFNDWGLSPSEQAVAVFAMKGFSNGEIANLRGTTESTIKSQMNSIFRKAGFSNRQQLISFLVEDLLAGVTTGEPVERRQGRSDRILGPISGSAASSGRDETGPDFAAAAEPAKAST